MSSTMSVDEVIAAIRRMSREDRDELILRLAKMDNFMEAMAHRSQKSHRSHDHQQDSAC